MASVIINDRFTTPRRQFDPLRPHVAGSWLRRAVHLIAWGSLLCVRHSKTIKERRLTSPMFRETDDTTWPIRGHDYLDPAAFHGRHRRSTAKAAWGSVRSGENLQRCLLQSPHKTPTRSEYGGSGTRRWESVVEGQTFEERPILGRESSGQQGLVKWVAFQPSLGNHDGDLHTGIPGVDTGVTNVSQ